MIDLVGNDEAIDASRALVANRTRIATITGFARFKQAGVRLLGHAPGADPGEAIRMGARAGVARSGGGRTSEGSGRGHAGRLVAEARRLILREHTVGKIVLIPKG